MIRTCMMFFCLTTFISCGNKSEVPSGILKPEKMQVVLWDVIKADAFTTGFIKKDSAKNPVEENLKLQQEIFAIHKISKVDFYKSYDYYKSNTPLFKNILDSMIAQAGREKNFKIKALEAE